MKRNEASLRNRRHGRFRPLLERLERRIVFASDFGDAPLPYKTLLVEGGAEHVAIGPTLGASRDTEAGGVHSANADGDDTTGIDDENGVTFGTIRTGALDATATVNVQGGPGRLDAWIDFNGDGSWGGPGEQIADTVAVVTGDNTISFDVPSAARDGTTYARFRLSTAGDLGVGGVATDGEVEDFEVAVYPPQLACGCFAAPENVSTYVGKARDVYADDLDGDGDIDIVSASNSENSLAWYENHGNLFFQQHVISQTPTFEALTVDVDGDGDTDVLAVGVSFAWYENNGDEQFTYRVIAGASSYSSIHAADVDGDGDLDVVTGSLNRTAWYENDGNQGFTSHTITTDTLGLVSVFTADVDSDGDADILSSSSSHVGDKIQWYEYTGSNSFIIHPITSDDSRRVSAADVDGDGDTDILSASPNDDRINWYENDGSQNFTPRTITAAANGAFSVHAADVDGDGDTDVLSASQLDDKVAWYENDGDENFTTHVITTAADGAYSVYAADVDGDSDVDVFSASINDHKVAWYENDGSQNFNTHVLTPGGAASVGLYAADVDSDGDNDVLTASGNRIRWYENHGSSLFTSREITTGLTNASSVVAADVDGDGDNDILSASFGDDTVAWYENDGNENFATHIISSENGAYMVFAVDMDGDGDIDILSSAIYGDRIAWHENDGNQNFTRHSIPTSVTEPHDVYAADVDSDGDIDVLGISHYNPVFWYENDGNQNFTSNALGTEGGSHNVFAADMDGDDDIDVLVDGPAWFENDGSGNFTPHEIGTSNFRVYPVDMDGDSDLDILAPYSPGIQDQGKVLWYENDGSQNYTSRTIDTYLGWQYKTVLPADMDGDGDFDVVVGSLNGGDLLLYENLNFVVVNANDAGPGSFRHAIEQANANPGVDTITFAIGSGYQTIAPASALPAITDSVTIDGTTQPGYAGAPLIEVWGLAAGPNVNGLTLAADTSTIKGIVVNLFSGNGILITGSGNTIENTYIGTDISGTIAVPNALNGIEIVGGFNNTIGGTAAGAANIIAFNDGRGILVDAGTNNAIRANSIHSNDGLGIDLINAGNNSQRAPSVNSAISGSGTTSIAASLAMVVPMTTYTIDFFSSAVCDPSGFGEGETYLGSKTLTTTATGRGRTMFVVGFEVPIGHVITATATSPFNDTSEFSMCRVVTAGLAPGGNGPNPPPLGPSSETGFLGPFRATTVREWLVSPLPNPPKAGGSDTNLPPILPPAVRPVTRLKLLRVADAGPLLDAFFSDPLQNGNPHEA